MATLVRFTTMSGFKVSINPDQVISVIENEKKEVEINLTVHSVIYTVKGSYHSVVQKLSQSNS